MVNIKLACVALVVGSAVARPFRNLNSNNSYRDYGPSRNCPLGTNSLVVIEDVEQRQNRWMIGKEGVILAHSNYETQPGYYIQLHGQRHGVMLFKCADVDAVNPSPSRQCNPDNSRSCPYGFTCQNLLGNTNGATSCVRNPPPAPVVNSCWIGPGCTSTVGGIPHSTNYEQITNNCFAQKSMCLAHNPSPSSKCNPRTNRGCALGYTCQNMLGNTDGATTCVKNPDVNVGCFANKGGMCVFLQETASDGSGGDACYATERKCKRSLGGGVGAMKKSKRTLRGLNTNTSDDAGGAGGAGGAGAGGAGGAAKTTANSTSVGTAPVACISFGFDVVDDCTLTAYDGCKVPAGFVGGQKQSYTGIGCAVALKRFHAEHPSITDDDTAADVIAPVTLVNVTSMNASHDTNLNQETFMDGDATVVFANGKCTVNGVNAADATCCAYQTKAHALKLLISNQMKTMNHDMQGGSMRRNRNLRGRVLTLMAADEKDGGN